MVKVITSFILFVFLTVSSFGAKYALPGVINSGRLDTFITVVNPNAEAAQVRIIVYEDAGANIGSVVGVPGHLGQIFEYEFELGAFETIRNAPLSGATPEFKGSVFIFSNTTLAGRAEIRSTQYNDDWQNIVIELQRID